METTTTQSGTGWGLTHRGREDPHDTNYWAVWAALGILMISKVVVAFTGWPRALVVAMLLVVAIWKALLVALYFMHLRFEPMRVVLVAASPVPLAVILVLAVMMEY